MNEEYLHYLFRCNLLGNTFNTVENKSLVVENRGAYNTNSGPDFLESIVSYDGAKWGGHIEFHVKSSDWYRHRHELNRDYDNVIAHFVYEHDRDVYTNQFKVPTVVLKPLINLDHYQHYLTFKNSGSWIACEKQILTVDPFNIFEQKEKVLFERLVRKSKNIIDLIQLENGDRQKALLITIARVFGAKVNQYPFEELAKKIQLTHLSKLDYDQFKIEAYLFGLSGLLNLTDCVDEYTEGLRKEFSYQQKLLGITEMEGNEWKFHRMRPAGFPTVRLALFAALLTNGPHLMNYIEEDKISNIKYNISNYWKNHYHFGRPSGRKRSGFSEEFKRLLYINAYTPYLFAIGLLEDNVRLKEYAFNFLSNISTESNSIIKKWRSLGLKIENALDSQALLELKNEYCDRKKCLSCKIGQKLLSVEG